MGCLSCLKAVQALLRYEPWMKIRYVQPLTAECPVQEEAVGILLLMADIHSEADQPCSALPYALSAWLHATELGMDLKVPHFIPYLPSGSCLLSEGDAVKSAGQGMTSNSNQQ